MAAIVTGWIVGILGVLLAIGGIWLAALGGTWAYIALGIGWAAAGFCLVARRAAALWVYAALLLFTLVWALAEAGLDRWALAPRLALFWLVGLWLLTPWVVRPLRRGRVALRGRGAASATGATSDWRTPRRIGGRGALAVVAVLVAIAGIVAMTRDGFDVAASLAGPDAGAHPGAAAPTDDWSTYGGTGYGQRYSALAQITPQNVRELKVAWTFHSGDQQGPNDPEETTAENVPLKVGNLLYLCTKHDHVVALDPASGEKRWEFDPVIHVSHEDQHLSCRGLLYHDARAAAAAPPTGAGATAATAAVAPDSPPLACERRIILPSIDARLYALDAATGQPCAGFGDHGVVNLAVNMGNLRPGDYMETSPPVITRHLIVLGASINDNESVANPSGVIRAFDVGDGHLVWSWDLGKPDPDAPLKPGERYTANTPPAWAPGSVDEALGLVYFPLGNQSPDELGQHRSAAVERYSSSVVALDLATGKLRWSFQGVHHDLWDRDMPAQPTLVDLDVAGATVPALVQPTKQGDVYVLDRRTGVPVVQVSETAAPASTLAGEHAASTQPHSALNFMPPRLTGRDMWGATPFDQLACRIRFMRMGYAGPYTPPSTRKTIDYPGVLGVFDWGGVAVDPKREALIGTPVHMAYVFQLVPRPSPDANVVTKGTPEHFNENKGASYAVRMDPFLSVLGLPCQQPPWGAIASADLRSGHAVWMHRNGTTRDRMPPFLPIPFPMGVPGFGGPLVTASGLVFYGGTIDGNFRAYDETTGRRLWQARLPAGGQATPMTYRERGKQYVVISAGGHGSAHTRLGDAVVAYALP
jgi:quinoprotein glucose dehydrogenase